MCKKMIVLVSALLVLGLAAGASADGERLGNVTVNEGDNIVYNGRVNMDEGDTLTVNGGEVHFNAELKFPDSSGNQNVHIYMHGGYCYSADTETYADRGSHLHIGAGTFRTCNIGREGGDPRTDRWDVDLIDDCTELVFTLDGGCVEVSAICVQVTLIEFESADSGALEAVSPAVLTVTLSEAAEQIITVDYAVTGGTATGGGVDYTLAAGTLTFNAGQTSKTINIDIVNDGADEDDETIIVTLSNPTGTDVELGDIAQHTYTIVDPRPAVGFATDADSGPEDPQIINRPKRIAVEMSVPAVSAVSVDYAVVGGTATGGDVDYSLVGGTLNFAPGELTKYIEVTIINDTLEEADETIVLGLSNVTGPARFGANTQHTYTILDDDTGAEPPNRDLNNDGVVDFQDVIVFLEGWLDCTLEPPELCWQ